MKRAWSSLFKKSLHIHTYTSFTRITGLCLSTVYKRQIFSLLWWTSKWNASSWWCMLSEWWLEKIITLRVTQPVFQMVHLPSAAWHNPPRCKESDNVWWSFHGALCWNEWCRDWPGLRMQRVADSLCVLPYLDKAEWDFMGFMTENRHLISPHGRKKISHPWPKVQWNAWSKFKNG